MGRMRAGVVSAALMLAAAVIMLPFQAANGQSPSTTVVLPAYSASISGTTQYFDAIASAGATKVTFELSGGPSDLSDVQIATGTPTIYGWLAAWNSTTVSNGSYTLNSIAAYSGGVSATSTSVPLTVNNPPPSTTVVFPASGATLNGSQTQIHRRRGIAWCDRGHDRFDRSRWSPLTHPQRNPNSCRLDRRASRRIGVVRTYRFVLLDPERRLIRGRGQRHECFRSNNARCLYLLPRRRRVLDLRWECQLARGQTLSRRPSSSPAEPAKLTHPLEVFGS